MSTTCTDASRSSAVSTRPDAVISTGEGAAPTSAETRASHPTAALATMLRIRHFEMTINELFAKGKVRGTAHLCVGQEAVPVGVCGALREDDTVCATHRGHGAAIAKGLSLFKLFAEIMGRRSGYCAGRGGSQHIACIDRGFLGTNGISGGGLPIAVGAALASQRMGLDRVSVAFFGDGVANQGTFSESLNMAAIWRLPVVFVCENNLYAMSAPIQKFVAGGDIAKRAEGYGMAHETIDGNDVGLVQATMSRFADRARAGEGPALLECMTYRQLGHSKSDQRAYRTREEESEWASRDPITQEWQRLLSEGEATERTLGTLAEGIVAEVKVAAEQATDSPPANADTLHDYVTPGDVPSQTGGAPCQV